MSGYAKGFVSGEEIPRAPLDRVGWPWVRHEVARPQTEGTGSHWPKISIVTPSLNQAQFLEETIRSVLFQDYPNLEYFVVDGGSTDGSLDILERYSPWIDGWVSEKDGGQANALNRGFRRATGEVHGFINSDDVLLPGALRRVARRFARQSSRRPLLVSFGGREFGEGAAEATIEPPEQPSLVVWLSSGTSLFQPACFWNRSLWNRLEGFREDYHFCFDKEFFLRAIFKEGAYERGDPEATALFRLHPAAKSARLKDVHAQENRRIGEEVRAEAWGVKRIAREERDLRALRMVYSMFEADSLRLRARRLLAATLESPDLLRQRIFWGAVKRLPKQRGSQSLVSPSSDSGTK